MKSKKKILIISIIILLFAIICGFIIYWNTHLRTVSYENTRQKITASGNQYKEYITSDYELQSDITYTTAKNYKGESQELKLDIYSPSNNKDSKRAAIVMVHGGSLTTGDKASDGILKSFCEDFSKMGYVVFNVNYRLDSSTSAKAQNNAIIDVCKAFTWIQDNSGTYGVDKNNIFLCGYSAGASIIVDMTYSNLASYEVDRNSIAGVIDISGIKLNMGKPQQSNPSCLIIHGTKDTTDSYSDSEHLKSTLTSNQVNCTLIPLEGLNHDVSTQYTNMRTHIAEFMYKELTGNTATINLPTGTDPEYAKVLKRISNNVSYNVKQLNVNLDGNLDEWSNITSIKLNQIKDAGDSLPADTDFSGEVKLAWNPLSPNTLYIAATITDDVIIDKNEPTGKWYNDDCLEIAFDLSNNEMPEQLIKWVCGADGKDLSCLATSDNMNIALSKQNNTSTYEIAIDISKIDSSLLQSKSATNIKSGMCIGFSISYNDSDKDTREHQIGWTAGKSSDRSTMGNIIFE